MFAVKLLDTLKIDDPVGAVPVHLFNGVFGTLCVGLFAVDKITGAATGNGLLHGGGMTLLMAQLKGIGAVAVYTLVVSSIFWLLIKYTIGLRVSAQEEIEGLDLGEHGQEAYVGFAPPVVPRRRSGLVALNPGRRSHQCAAGHPLGGFRERHFVLYVPLHPVRAARRSRAWRDSGFGIGQQKPVFNGAIDFPTVYFFRGIRQEADPKFTTFVAGDLGIPLLADGSGALKTATINVGTWNAFLTGSSGSDRPDTAAFYESDLYAGVTLGFGAISFTPMFTAYTSPNDVFTTVKEISFKVAHASKTAPYALVAFEIGGDGSGQADGGSEQGTYLELGIGPSWPIADGKATVAVPVKLGLSLKDYYELSGEDQKFGYLAGGVLFTVPFERREVRMCTAA